MKINYVLYLWLPYQFSGLIAGNTDSGETNENILGDGSISRESSIGFFNEIDGNGNDKVTVEELNKVYIFI